MFHTKVDKIKTKEPYPENRAVYETMRKKNYCLAGQAKDGDMAHAHCILDN
jgi:hypothetical protein